MLSSAQLLPVNRLIFQKIFVVFVQNKTTDHHFSID